MDPSTLQDLLLANTSLTPQQHASAQTYLNKLLHSSLPTLTAEPASLTSQGTSLDADLSNLCLRSFPTLLASYASSQSMHSGFYALESSLDAFVSRSKSLTDACRDFDSHTQSTIAQRTQIKSVLPNLESVGDVLDLPRLVHACVLAGCWADALDVATKAHDLRSLALSEGLGKAQASLDAVCEAVEQEMGGLKIRVLQLLGERSLKLPAALRAVSFLRRLSSSSSSSSHPDDAEGKLQLVLLASRWDCLTFACDALYAGAELSTDDLRTKYLKRVIDTWREVVGDAANMYSEIFLSSSSSYNNKAHLVGFLHLALEKLLSMIQGYVDHLHSGSALATLSTHLSYCSNAFATRFGFDFKPSVDTLIRSRVQSLVQDRWSTGLSTFQAHLRRKQPLEQVMLAPESLHRALALPIPDKPTNEDGFAHQPSSQLALFPPLAILVNALASALNEMRLLPSATVTLFPLLQQQLARILSDAAQSMCVILEASWPSAEREEEDGERRQLVKAICAWTSRVCLPWCARALVEAARDAGAQEVQAEVQLDEQLEGLLARLSADKSES